MLKGTLIHPGILEALGRAGHGSRVLLADGNYPVASKLGPRSRLVHLNLRPGLVGVTPVLEALVTAIPIEAAAVMDDGSSGTGSPPPEVWSQFEEVLRRSGSPDSLERLERWTFYEAGASPDVALTIATGEQRVYANLLLTIGVVPP